MTIVIVTTLIFGGLTSKVLHLYVSRLLSLLAEFTPIPGNHARLNLTQTDDLPAAALAMHEPLSTDANSPSESAVDRNGQPAQPFYALKRDEDDEVCSWLSPG